MVRTIFLRIGKKYFRVERGNNYMFIQKLEYNPGEAVEPSDEILEILRIVDVDSEGIIYYERELTEEPFPFLTSFEDNFAQS